MEALLELASECSRLTRACADAGVPEAEDAHIHIRIAEDILARLQRTSKELQGPLAGATESLTPTLNAVRGKARRLLEKRKAIRGLHGCTQFNKWLLQSSREYREFFFTLAVDLEKKVANLRVLGKMDPRTTTVDALAAIPSEEGQKLWEEVFAAEYWRVDWKKLSIAIARVMDVAGLPLSDEGLHRIKHLLCVGRGDGATGSTVTCSAFGWACQKHGFPFDMTTIPTIEVGTEKQEQLSLGERLLLSREVAELAQSYTSLEVTTSINAITNFLVAEGVDAPSKWASCLKDPELKCHTAEDFKRMQRVDEQRRRWSFFFVRYMMLWRVSPVAQDLFTDVDFPSVQQIMQFLRVSEPFDEAYMRVVLGADRMEWERKRPKVYLFLRLLLRQLRIPDSDVPPLMTWQGVPRTT